MMGDIGFIRSSLSLIMTPPTERRSTARTTIFKGALLFFSGQNGVRACTVKDTTNVGACIRLRDLAAVPLDFELSFDNFRTVRKCRLIWRDGDFVGVVFKGVGPPNGSAAA